MLDASPSRKPALLLVEPDLQLASALERWLADDYDVVIATNGWRAVEAARTLRPDLVLAELRLPDFDPSDLYDMLEREMPGVGDRVLFITSGFVADRAQQFLARVPGQVIEKPFDVSRLRSLLLELLSVRR